MNNPIPDGPADRTCPFHRKAMKKVCAKCPMWVQIRGKNPQSEAEIDRWDCSFALLPLLLIENAQQQRQTGAAVESFRNESVRADTQFLRRLAEAAAQMPRGLGHNEVNGGLIEHDRSQN